MKKILQSISVASLLSMSAMATDGGMDLPSSTPIQVFEMQKDQIGVGYMQFNVKMELEDDYYGDKIGDVDYDNKGLIVTLPANTDTIIGKMFEYSYTAGVINSKLKDKQFTDGSSTYNNTYSKQGFYVGVRPAFSASLYENSSFKVQSATALHMVLYTLSGDFSVNNGTDSYAYDETSYGLGLKPSTIINGTYYPISNLGISAFGGLSTFLALDYNNYSGKNNTVGSDSELLGYMSTVDPIYGFDVTFKGIASKDDFINLSSVFANKNSNTSMETIIRYVFTF